MKYLNGNCENEKRFVIINTTQYNGDGEWGIIVCSFEELEDCGFDDDERYQLNGIKVGESWNNSIYGDSAQVVRIG